MGGGWWLFVCFGFKYLDYIPVRLEVREMWFGFYCQHSSQLELHYHNPEQIIHEHGIAGGKKCKKSLIHIENKMGRSEKELLKCLYFHVVFEWWGVKPEFMVQTDSWGGVANSYPVKMLSTLLEELLTRVQKTCGIKVNWKMEALHKLSVHKTFVLKHLKIKQTALGHRSCVVHFMFCFP